LFFGVNGAKLSFNIGVKVRSYGYSFIC
jgi:hypothetical protein